MRVTIYLIALAIIIFSIMSCASQHSLRKVYVESVVVSPHSTSDKTTLVFEGNLPNTAYQFHHTDVKVGKNKIHLTPLAKFDEDVIYIPVLIPFSDTVRVKLVKQQRYEVMLHGINRTLIEVIEGKTMHSQE